MSDVQGLLTEHLDIWTTAESGKKSGRGRSSGNGETVYGVKKLRELILELAVRGKLVTQDPKDEPASELLKRIQAEKAKLIAAGKIKRDKSAIGESVEEYPFVLPQGWKFVKLNELLSKIGAGSTPLGGKQVYLNEGVPFLRSQNVWDEGLRLDDVAYISPETHEKMSGTHVCPGDLLFNITGASIGRCAIVPDEFITGNVSQHVTIVRPVKREILAFLHLVLISRHVQQTVMDVQVGVSREGLSIGKLSQFLIPVPPIQEQHRIVAKVDELMALCDQLEAQHNNAADAHEKLVTHLLGTLTQSQDAADFNANWQRIAEHFDTLFTTEHSIDTLKQTLLQLAVMGKLVPQDPNDEPASELLKRIIEKKQELIKRGIYKNKKAVKPQRDDIMLPSSWEKICVQDFADVRLGATPSRTNPGYWGGDIPWVSSGEVANNIIYETNEKITLAGFQSSSVTMIPARSLLIAIIGQGKTRGQSAILGIDACTNQNVAALVFDERTVSTEYVWIWAKSKYESHRGDGRGGAQPALNGEIVRSFTFHLPPIAEQQRIVKKTNELMTLCDHLKSRITDATQLKQKIADALVEQALH